MLTANRALKQIIDRLHAYLHINSSNDIFAKFINHTSMNKVEGV